MSQPGHDDESFFREVDEDYRRDQAIKFFEDYGAYLLAGAFIIVAVVAGYNFQQQPARAIRRRPAATRFRPR